MTKRQNNSKEISTKERTRSLLRSGAAPLAAVGVTGLGVAGYYTGVLPDLMNTQIVPESSAIDGAVNAMVTANEGIRTAAPIAAIGMVSLAAYYNIAGRFNSKQNAINHLSKTEYSGIDDVVHGRSEKKQRQSVSRFKKAIGGVGVLSATLVMATSGLEKDVTEGSLRPIHAVTDIVRDNDESLHFVLESSNNTFMDDSTIARDTMSDLIEDAAEKDITIIPFSKELMNVNDTSSIQVSLPDAVFSQAAQFEVDESCDTIPVIVDDTLGAEQGDEVLINGSKAQVIGVKSGLAQMNRSVTLLADSDMRCLKDDTDDAYFGAIVKGGSTDELQALILPETATVVDEERFYENNKDFWRANGTPLILILMGSVAVLGAAASAGERRSALLQNVREIGMLNANGVEMADIKRAESRRALRRALYESAVAAPLAVGVAGAFNKTVSGLGVGIGLREVAVGAAITWVSKEVAARRAFSGLAKTIDLSQAVKG